MDLSYWKKQTAQEPLFPNIAWSKPEQRAYAGRLAIIGGNKLGFAGVAEAYGIARETGVGEARVLLPDALRKTIPSAITDAVFASSNPAGSLSKDALTELNATGAWAESVLLIGDAGRNSETAIAYETFVRTYKGQLVVTRDAIDLLKNSTDALIDRPDTVLVASFAQLQKIFQAVYYPKVLTFSMQLLQLVEAVHKFTLTYPSTLVVLHKETLVIAHNGEVITTPWDQPMLIWRGTVAAQAACYWLWNPKKPAQAIATSIL
jgi:ADP-dependent NAD(P)H-hydrate dehydratase / NAD(P)H-hydrate epimerase